MNADVRPLGEAQQNEAKGVVRDIKTSTFQTKDGRTVPNFKLEVGDQVYSGIGTPPTVTMGDEVTVRFRINGNYKNITDILKAGESVLPRRKYGGNQLAKANLVLAAAMICCHNSQITKQPVMLKDIQSILPDLEKMAGL